MSNDPTKPSVNNPQQAVPQASHPMNDGPHAQDDATPKVDVRDSGAKILPPSEAVGVMAEQQAKITERLDAEQAKGYAGHNPDPTPNEAYTLPGVLGQNSPDKNAPQPDDPGVSPNQFSHTQAEHEEWTADELQAHQTERDAKAAAANAAGPHPALAKQIGNYRELVDSGVSEEEATKLAFADSE